MENQDVDRMAIAVVYQAQSRELLDILNEKRFPVTLLDAVGGFLQEPMVTLVVGVPHRRLPYFFYLVRDKCPAHTRYMPLGMAYPCYPECQMVEVRVGGASVFVLPVERFTHV